MITLDPPTDTNTVGEEHTVTATITDGNGDAVSGIEVTFTVISGPNAGDSGTDTTDANGQATFTYTGDGGPGNDTIKACYTDNGQTVCSQTVTKVWNAAEGGTITLAPEYDLNLRGDEHTVTATVMTAAGPAVGVEVTFTILSGPNAGDGGMVETNASGLATFTYTGDGPVGTDQIQACFGSDPPVCSNIVEKEWTEEIIEIDPLVSSNPVYTGHTVTATITDLKGTPLPGILVTFTVVSGPNAGDSGTDTTDASGEATFTYTGDGGPGMDQIQACFTNNAEEEVCSDTAYKEWIVPPPPPIPTLSQWGIVFFTVLTALLAILLIQRRKKGQAGP